MRSTVPRKALTVKAVDALKSAAPGTRYTVYDALVPGFGVRVSDKRKRTFIMYRRLGTGGRPVRHTLGEYVAGAKEGEEGARSRRAKAREAFTALKSGRDPKDEERKHRQEEARRQNNTITAVAEDFIKHYVSTLRSGDHMEAVIRRELIVRWGGRPITEIERRDVVELVEDLARKDKPHAARLALAHARTFFDWAIGRSLYGLPEASPCDRVRVGKLIGKAKLRPRERVLEDGEIRLVWRAAGKAGRAENPGNARPKKDYAAGPRKPGYPFGDMARLLLLTGLRLREVAEARWRESTWTARSGQSQSRGRRATPTTSSRCRQPRSRC
jgi:integrase